MRKKTKKQIEKMSFEKYPDTQIISALGGFEDSNLDLRRGFVEGFLANIEIVEKMQKKIKNLQKELTDYIL